ncbi:hypothetical protein MMC20_004123 [Loxospora ochrophaea]|nr:hypothetical protein [Loxospora ochrophaea]
MSSGLMDTQAGGESTQYESIQTVTKPHAKDGGQLGDAQTEADMSDTAKQQDMSKKGEKMAENIRYGESISEHGFGGETQGNDGVANQGDGFGATDALSNQSGASQARSQQGYSGGSGVGA